MKRTFLREICDSCKHWEYLNSDYGRLGADHYTCAKGVFRSTRDEDWYPKAEKCKCFDTPYSLSDDRLKEIGRI